MRLEVIDFPSDSNCELPKGFRETLTYALQRATESVSCAEVLRANLSFAVSKLKIAEAESKERVKMFKESAQRLQEAEELAEKQKLAKAATAAAVAVKVATKAKEAADRALANEKTEASKEV